MTEELRRFLASKERSHHRTSSYIMYSPMSRVPAFAGDPWWLPYESVLLAHLTQPFQLHLHQLPVYWTLTQCYVEPHCYWKGFVIWKIASNKAQKTHSGGTYVSYRFQLHRGGTQVERAVRNFLDAAAVSWLCCACVLQSWRIVEEATFRLSFHALLSAGKS